jgi:hypothetical protein
MHPNELTLNEYVDQTLGPDERAVVARHLEGCAACRQLVEDLREITRAAAALDTPPPPPRVWEAIAHEIARRPPRTRGTYGGSQIWTWLAAAAVLVLAVFIGVRFGPPRPAADVAGVDGSGDTQAAARAVEEELKLAEEHYQKAISGLEAIANAQQAVFDPDTAATLQKNFAVINQAIDESRAAIQVEPASQQAQHSLIENFKTKLALLQDTVALITELRAGNEEAAARIVSGS